MSKPNVNPQYADHSGLEVAHPNDPLGELGSDKVVVHSTPDKYILHPEASEAFTQDSGQVESSSKLGNLFKRRKWLILAGLGVVIVIVAAVLGGVLSKKKSRSDGTATNSSSSSLTSSPSRTSSTSTSNPSAIPFRYSGNIAAASFTWNQAGGGTRVYYQDRKGELVQSVTQDNKTWTSTKLGVFPQNGTALAVAVSQIGYDTGITVLYTSSSGLLHDFVYSDSGGWAEGSLSAQNYIAAASSRLSVFYNQCAKCANTVGVVYQDRSGTVQFGNRTSKTSWTLTSLNLGALVGTGLALQAPMAYGNIQNQINLFFQGSTNTLKFASWKENAAAWNQDGAFYDTTPGTPIAAIGSDIYTYDSSNNPSTVWILVLTLAATGIVVDAWGLGVTDWVYHQRQFATISNLTGTARSFGSLAVTSQGFAFAVVTSDGKSDEIQFWSTSTDLTVWTSLGSLDVSSSWV